MHMTRPKSSKGRTRTRVTPGLAVNEGIHQSHMFSPHPPPPPTSPTLVPTCTVLRRSSKTNTDVFTEIFERPPDGPVLSLNKYRVLPSIEKRPEDELARIMEEKASRLSLSDSSLRVHQLQREQHITHLQASRSDPDMGNVYEVQGVPIASNPEKISKEFGYSDHGASITSDVDTLLLLAIRTPCGQRFKCHFQPTETLQAVAAAAEAKTGERYERALIQTMEVPRRTFTNLTMTLSQCSIFNKSVLCISLEDGAMDSDS